MRPQQDMTRITQTARWRTSLAVWSVGPTFLLLAVWLIWGGVGGVPPVSKTPAFDADQLSTAPRRKPLGDPPIITIAGFERNCMECHRLFDSPPQTTRRLTQHTHIKMDHGLNDACFNCHDREDRNRLSLGNDKTTGFADVPRLCAKCHGPTYRDWQRGIHGRTNGYWDASQGEPHRLVCVACHDPHAPAYPDYVPLPGPHTLRMGEPHEAGEDSPVELADPLRHWHRRRTFQPPAHDPVQTDHAQNEYDDSESDAEQSP